MNIRKRLTNCYMMNNTKEASKILEVITNRLTKEFEIVKIIPISELKNLTEKEKERIEKITVRIAELTLALVELRFYKWKTTLELIASMPDMEI